jgi:hypothetical protein
MPFRLRLIFFFLYLLFVLTFSKNILFYNDLDEPSSLCSDGSSAGYFFRPASSLPWIIVLDPGAIPCFDLISCSFLNNTSQTSSKTLPSRLTFTDGILNSEFDIRLLHANLVFIPHCSADAFIGNRPIPPIELSTFSSFKNGFNGKSIVESVLIDLIKTHGLASQPIDNVNTDVLVVGGLSTLVGCSYYEDFIDVESVAINGGGDSRRFVDVKCFVDNKLWLRQSPLVNSAGLGTEAIIERIYNFVNGQDFLSLSQSQCVDDYFSTPYICFLGDIVLGYIPSTIPLFINVQLYDAYQLVTVDGLTRTMLPNTWTITEKSYAQEFRLATTNLLVNEVNRYGQEFRSFFASACYDTNELEIVSGGQPWSLSSAFSKRLVIGLSLEVAVSSWFFNKPIISNGQTLDPYRDVKLKRILHKGFTNCNLFNLCRL